MKKIIQTFLVLIIMPALAHAWLARVVSVADGDTITVEPIDGGDP